MRDRLFFYMYRTRSAASMWADGSRGPAMLGVQNYAYGPDARFNSWVVLNEDALAVMSVTRVVLAVTSVTCVVCDDRPIWSLAVVNTPVLYLHCKYV